MDPLQYPNFYPYIPNEVKHRKRTSSAQLKVLETMFKTDTKPNAGLRKKLAQELDMTPRGVQVWFQNRRAKEKNKASKAAEAAKRLAAVGFPTSPAPADLSSSPELPSASEDTLVENQSSQAHSPPTWNVSPAPTPASSDLESVQFPCADPYLIRRGSLPADLYLQPSPSYPPLSDPNEYARRCSVDTSLQMLARNPYANLASRRTLAPNQMDFSSRSHQRPSIEMGHVSMDPRAMYYHDTGSPSSQDSFSHSPSPHSPLGSLPDANSYTAPSRVVPPTIPGPLPTEGFIFGAASHEMYHQGGDFTDGDDTSSSYDALSRFGSITSTTTSDSSVYFSECGDDAYLGQTSRRGSASGINDLMSTMSFQHPGNMPVLGSNDESVSSPGESRDGSDRTTKYPSPAPTVSPPSGSPVIASEQPRLELVYPATYMEGGIGPHPALTQSVYTSQPHTGSSLVDLPLQYSHHPSEYPHLEVQTTGHYQDPTPCYTSPSGLAGAFSPIQQTQGEFRQVVQVPAYAGGVFNG